MALFECPAALTFDTVPRQRQRLIGILTCEHDDELCIELQNVRECDSAGLALLIEARRLCHQYKKSLLISGLTDEIRALATFCGLEEIFNDK